MGMLNVYNWGLPNQAEHLARYKDNEPLYNMVRSLWNSLDSASMFFVAVVIIVAVIAACCYYYGYNKLPGRKYRISHWVIWLGITAVLSAFLTMVIGNAMVSSTLKDKFEFILRISLINGLYASIIYFMTSFIICNLPYSTNAYRFLKLGK